MSVTQVLGTDKTIRLNDYNTLGLVQNFNWAPNFNAQDVFELGRTTRLDTLMELETSGSFELSSAGNLAGIIARMKPQFTASEFSGFQYAPSVSGTGVNGYTFTQDQLTDLTFDIIQHEKTEQLNFDRSTYLACCYPTSFAGRVDATGMAMDTINWAGLYVVGFPAPFHDIRAVPCTRATATTATVTGGINATTHTLAYVTVDGRPVRTVADAGVSASFATSTITFTGMQLNVGAVIMAVFHRNTPLNTPTGTPNTNWATVHTPNTVGTGANAVFGVRGFQANVYIAPVNPSLNDLPGSEQWLKVQSVDYNLDLRVEALRQVAFNSQGTTIYTRVPTLPFATTVNATVNEADWADWKAILQNKTFTGANIYNNTYDFAPNNLKSSFAVVIEYFTKGGTKIQRVRLDDLRVDGMGNRINVGGRGEITWSFRGSAFQVQGFNP